MTVDNIVSTFDLVPAATRLAASGWYDEARDLASTLYPDNPRTGAGVIAALSPMNPWPRNKAMAILVSTGVDYKDVPYLKGNAFKAMRIHQGGIPETYLLGEKVLSFYYNILGESCDETVTIDRHAVDIAMGIPGYYAQRGINKREYAMFRKEYVDACAVINSINGTTYTPAQIQAITWVWWRENRAKMYHKG